MSARSDETASRCVLKLQGNKIMELTNLKWMFPTPEWNLRNLLRKW